MYGMMQQHWSILSNPFAKDFRFFPALSPSGIFSTHEAASDLMEGTYVCVLIHNRMMWQFPYITGDGKNG